jgi:hypothetical protein
MHTHLVASFLSPHIGDSCFYSLSSCPPFPPFSLVLTAVHWLFHRFGSFVSFSFSLSLSVSFLLLAMHTHLVASFLSPHIGDSCFYSLSLCPPFPPFSLVLTAVHWLFHRWFLLLFSQLVSSVPTILLSAHCGPLVVSYKIPRLKA